MEDNSHNCRRATWGDYFMMGLGVGTGLWTAALVIALACLACDRLTNPPQADTNEEEVEETGRLTTPRKLILGPPERLSTPRKLLP